MKNNSEVQEKNIEEENNTKNRVGKLVKELVGDRSIRQAGIDSGVTASYISGIINGKNLPSAEILRKLTMPSAKPQRGITLEDLMVTAGYQLDYMGIIDTSEDKEKDSYSILTIEQVKDLTESQLKRVERYAEAKRFENSAKGIILSFLTYKKVSFSHNQSEPLGMRGIRPDLVIDISEKGIREWWFEFKQFSSNSEKARNYSIRRDLSQLIFIEAQRERKVSIVVNCEKDFESLVSYKDVLAYRGDLSVILIDEEKYLVIKEIYISHFDINDSNSEFVLN